MCKCLIPVFALILFACNKEFDVEHIKSKTWSFQGGYKIGKGEIMIFEESEIYELKSDTKFCLGVPKTLIIQLDKSDYTLKVKSLNDQQTGEYMDTEGSFE